MVKGGHAWDTTRYGDMINERAVRILLECILVVCAIVFAMYKRTQLVCPFDIRCSPLPHKNENVFYSV